ncbi:trypsin-like serine protease [Bdellovibrio bacteriovorus]|uniref:S1 family peptidase n=1 Tax=Bdellovibrio bacteriovorus TaxID=959 RepID=UPI0035A6C6A9
MRVLLCFLVLTMLACQQNADSSATSWDESQNGIVGGFDVPATSRLHQQVLDFKIVVTVEKKDAPPRSVTSQCTASAIAPTILLTAGHCIATSAATEAHTVHVMDAQGAKVSLRAIRVVVHPEYIAGNKNSDLALVLLEKPLPENIEILNLPEKEPSLNLVQVQAAGYGRMDGRPAYKGYTGILRTTNLDVVAYDPLAPSFIVSQNQGKGFCQGDSGGPAILVMEDKSYVVGVASRTFFNPEVPLEERNLCIDRGAYITVQFHIDWIREEARKLGQN